MKERIKRIMEEESMTPARFADSLEIGRAVISHILNGRNNPSLDIITRILTKMPQINTDWLLTGSGTMYRIENNNSNENSVKADSTTRTESMSIPDLFAQIPIEKSTIAYDESKSLEYREENTVGEATNEIQNIIKEQIVYKEAPVRKIKQIIIYYSDNTFETFNA